MHPTARYPSLYVKVNNGEMDGAIGVYVDETLNSRTAKIHRLWVKIFAEIRF